MTVSLDYVARNAPWGSFFTEASFLGLVEGSLGGTFNPKAWVTRAEGITMLYRLIQLREE